MSKFLPALIAAALSVTSLTIPCYANDASDEKSSSSVIADGPAPTADDQSRSGSAIASSTSDATALIASTSVLPIRVAAVTAAFALGAPIAIARCEAKQMGEYGDAMATELNRNQFITPLMVASIPCESLQAVLTAGKGLLISGSNAASAWKDPFTAKSFSLEELER